MAPHSSTLAWKIPWTEEPGRLQSMGSLRVGHDWATSLSLFHFDALEKEMATHSSVLAWRILEMGEPGGLPSVESHRVGHDWSDLAAAAAAAAMRWMKLEPIIQSKVTQKEKHQYSILTHIYRIYKDGNHKFVFSVWVCFCFVNKFICIYIFRCHI